MKHLMIYNAIEAELFNKKQPETAIIIFKPDVDSLYNLGFKNIELLPGV